MPAPDVTTKGIVKAVIDETVCVTAAGFINQMALLLPLKLPVPVLA